MSLQHGRIRAALALATILGNASVFADTPSTTPKSPGKVVWINGELAPPLPDDPAIRAAVREQLARKAATWKVPPGAPTVTYTGSSATGTMQAVPVAPGLAAGNRARETDMGPWFQTLHSRLQPPAESKRETAPLQTGGSTGPIVESPPVVQIPNTITSFDGIDDTGLRPAAPDIAAGPKHILLATTDRFAVMDKCGNTLLTDTFQHFFNKSATAAYYTPRVVYDEWNQHWIMVWIGTETNYSVSSVYVAFTSGPDPTTGWSVYAISSPSFPGFKDFPGVAVTPYQVYVTWDRYNLSTLVFESAVIGEIDATDFYNGGNVAISMKTGMTNPSDGSLVFSIRPAQLHTLSGVAFFVNDKAQGGDFLTVWGLTGSPGSSTLTGFGVTIGAYVLPNDVAQPDATLLDAGDCRVLDAVYNAGHLYETHDEKIAGQPAVTVTYVDTWDFDHYKLSYQSAVGDANAYGAIDVDANDQVALIFSGWGSVKFPSLFYRFAEFPPGANLGGGTLILGQDNFNSGAQPYRWGPYAGCARDPVDARTMWIYGMYASNSPLDSWATKVGAISTFDPSVLLVNGTESFYYAGGFVGGPFSSDTFNYDLQNIGQTTANWTVTNIPSWLTAATTSGHVGPGETQSISLQLSPQAYTLGEGSYSTFLNFENCTGVGSIAKFIGIGIGRDGSCPGAGLPLYPTTVPPPQSGSLAEPGMYITAIEHMDVCAVDVTAQLVEIPQLVYARIYQANGVTRGPLLAESFFTLVKPGNVKHSIPLAAALEPCKEYEVSVEFTGLVDYDTYPEASLGLPNDVGGVVRLRNASQGGNAASTDVAQIQLVTAVDQGCGESSIVDLGGSKGVAAQATPDVGIYVQPKQTVRLCTVALNFGAAAGTRVTARVYASSGSSRDYVIAEGSAVVSLPYLNYVEVPISARLIGGSEYDVAVQVDGTAFYEVNTTGSTPHLVDGVFNVLDGEASGIAGASVPTLQLRWTDDEAGIHFTLGKPAGPYPPPVSLGSPVSQGMFVTSLIKQEIYGLGVYADIPAGNLVGARVYDATGNTRGALLTFGSVLSDASGPRWHDVPLSASLAANKDYDFAVSATTVTGVPAWLDTSGLPYVVSGVLRVRDGEKDGLASNDKLVYARMNACNATATPVVGRPTRTPVLLNPPSPNPGSHIVRFGYALESEGPVEISIYDVTGHRVAEVFSADRVHAGAAETNYDVSRLASGVYFVRLTVPGKTLARKLVVTH
jgi:hypothetical protein